MVLADQKETKIHASVKKSLVSRHERHLTQGHWRVIENFSLGEVKGQYRGEAPAFFVDHLENGYTNGFGLKSEPKNRDTSVQIGDRSYVIGGNHEGNPLFLGVQIRDKITNKWYSPTVLGTGPKPCKGYSANVLEKGGILVIKKGSASEDSIWFLDVDTPFVREQKKFLGREVVAWSKGTFLIGFATVARHEKYYLDETARELHNASKFGGDTNRVRYQIFLLIVTMGAVCI